MKLDTGQILEGRYQIVRTIQSGGMGAVYEALDTRLADGPCAVKVMLPREGVSGSYVEGRFLLEMKVLAALNHAGIPHVRDFFCKEGTYIIVMDLVVGLNLAQVIQSRTQPMGGDEVIGMALQVLEILKYLHSRQPPILHRDIKPSNLILEPGGDIKLVDFGIACDQTDLTRTQVGTVGYCPLEQMQGKAVVQSDLYALGATMHHMLTGCSPLPLHFESLISKRRDLSVPLIRAVNTAISHEVQDRFASAADFAAALQAALGSRATLQLPGEDEPTGLVAPPKLPGAQNPTPGDAQSPAAAPPQLPGAQAPTPGDAEPPAVQPPIPAAPPDRPGPSPWQWPLAAACLVLVLVLVLGCAVFFNSKARVEGDSTSSTPLVGSTMTPTPPTPLASTPSTSSPTPNAETASLTPGPNPAAALTPTPIGPPPVSGLAASFEGDWLRSGGDRVLLWLDGADTLKMVLFRTDMQIRYYHPVWVKKGTAFDFKYGSKPPTYSNCNLVHRQIKEVTGHGNHKTWTRTGGVPSNPLLGLWRVKAADANAEAILYVIEGGTREGFPMSRADASLKYVPQKAYWVEFGRQFRVPYQGRGHTAQTLTATVSSQSADTLDVQTTEGSSGVWVRGWVRG